MEPQNNEIKICKIDTKIQRKSKYWRNGTRRGFDGTTYPRGARKKDKTLKEFRNPIPWNLDNLCKGIWELVPNRIWRQWPRGLTIPTQGYLQQTRVVINSSNKTFNNDMPMEIKETTYSSSTSCRCRTGVKQREWIFFHPYEIHMRIFRQENLCRGCEVRSRADYILGTDLRLPQNVLVRYAQHKTDH